MTPEQVRDKVHDALLWLQAQRTSPEITSVVDIGTNEVDVGFDDGTDALITIFTTGGQP